MQRISRADFGHERQPLIVVDNFVDHPEQLIEDAAMLSFIPIGPHFPGVRAAVHPSTVSRFLSSVSGLISDVFGVTSSLAEIECWYSLTTTPPEALAPIQRLPHFDSADPRRIALLHYLIPGEQGGTSFFRHRGTGFESVNADKLDHYSATIDADVARHGVPDATYISGDTPMFERIAHCEARFNRAIIYRGNTIHCADIPLGMELSADPKVGRLTVNTFINGRPERAA